MQSMPPEILPAPAAAALQTSTRLTALVQQTITQAGGWISFADYLRLALYAPGLGYYAAGSCKFGPAGDFVTAPETSPLFARTLARPVAQVLAEAGGDVLELGAGSGRLAADLLAELEALGTLPQRYCILEVSAELALRQRETLAQLPPHLRGRVVWLQQLPSHFRGCVLGNEVLDALPFRLLHRQARGWQERGVGWQEGLVWQDRPLRDEAARHLPDDLPTGYLTEIQPEALGLIASLYDAVDCAALIFIDYGFDAGAYYHPQRHQGTLMCHFRHHSHDDPFFLPGLQDITTHIDFSALYQQAVKVGWRLEGYTSQAAFLLDAGLMEVLPPANPATSSYLQATAQVHTLVNPAEMGELFKVIGFSRQMHLEGLLRGFRSNDLSGRL